MTQPERDNPLMRRHFDEIGLPGKRLAERCGVSHSQIYMARKRNVGADNAEKISRGVAGILGLSEEDRLRLKAEIMGCLGEPLRAWFGDPEKAARLLGIPRAVAEEVLDEEKSVTHGSGARALKGLREMDAPLFVVGSVERRLMPPPEPRRGLVTHDLHGPEMVEQRKRTRASLEHGKPRTHEAIRASGLALKEIREMAGVGKETLRRGLYGGNLSLRSARAIAGSLREACGLSVADTAAVENELRESPREPS